MSGTHNAFVRHTGRSARGRGGALVRTSRQGTAPSLSMILLAGVTCCLAMADAGNKKFSSKGLSDQKPAAVIQATLDERQLIDWAGKDPVGLLEEAIRRCDRTVKDYQGTFVFQETVAGKLRPEAVCKFKFRSKPFSITMQWTRGQRKIDRLLYVAGRDDARMIVHPTGLSGRLFPTVELNPLGKRAAMSSARPITAFGLRNALVRALESYRASMKAGHFSSRCIGLSELNGTRAVTLEKTDANGRGLIVLDAATLMPLEIRCFSANGKLQSMYSYRDLEFNVGLDNSSFARVANGFSKQRGLLLD